MKYYLGWRVGGTREGRREGWRKEQSGRGRERESSKWFPSLEYLEKPYFSDHVLRDSTVEVPHIWRTLLKQKKCYNLILISPVPCPFKHKLIVMRQI